MPYQPTPQQRLEEYHISVHARLDEIHRPLREHDRRERARLTQLIWRLEHLLGLPDVPKPARIDATIALTDARLLLRDDYRENALHNELPAVPVAMRAELEA